MSCDGLEYRRVQSTQHHSSTSPRWLTMLRGVLLGLALQQPAIGADACYITNIDEFLEVCPNNDPAITEILADFTIKVDGVEVTEFPCTEPISTLPIEAYTDELVLLQVLRLTYYMDRGRSGHLPWTSMSLYDWLKSQVGGFNITGSTSSCCGTWPDGRQFITLRKFDDINRDLDRTWPYIGGNLALVMHEARHIDGFPHVSCCSLGVGCDVEYNETNLSPHGIQWWLNKSWLDDDLHTGYACLPSVRVRITQCVEFKPSN